MRRFTWLMVLAAIALGGCVTPTQYQGTIPVDHDGFAGRLAAVCDMTQDGQKACNRPQ